MRRGVVLSGENISLPPVVAACASARTPGEPVARTLRWQSTSTVALRQHCGGGEKGRTALALGTFGTGARAGAFVA